MSYKKELQENNKDLRGLIDLANSLPDAENLDAEMDAQEELLNQILIDLENKSAPTLPELSNPAGPEQIVSGYQGIDPDGTVIDGILAPVEFIEETVTASSDFKLTLSDSVIAKENWLIYLNSTGDSGTSQQITFVLVNNKNIITGRYGTSGGTRGDMAGNSIGIDGNSVYYSTSQYGTRFTGSYVIKAW